VLLLAERRDGSDGRARRPNGGGDAGGDAGGAAEADSLANRGCHRSAGS